MTTKKNRKPKEAIEIKPIEVKPTVEEPKEAKATPKPIPPTPIEVKPPKEAKEVKVTPITIEEFESFTPTPNEKEKKRSLIKEAIEKAKKEPVKIEGLTRGQISALIRTINDYNFKGEDPKITYKYDIKRGIVLLAPKPLLEKSLYMEVAKEVFKV